MVSVGEGVAVKVGGIGVAVLLGEGVRVEGIGVGVSDRLKQPVRKRVSSIHMFMSFSMG